MNRTWLILDCNFLCHRAFHALGELSHDDESTGVVFGFLRDVLSFQEQFDTKNIIFCWDYGYGIRRHMLPSYKGHRRSKEKTIEEEVQAAKFRRQVRDLRLSYLKTIGFNNILFQLGYESDDLIAKVCEVIPRDNTGIIVTSDQDLYQCIRPNIMFYPPSRNKPIITYQSFYKQYGIKPYQWSTVKALAGCHSDNVKGIPGIGIKTAIKYLTGTLKPQSAKYRSIKEGSGVLKRNLKLVKLPLEGTMSIALKEDDVSRRGWVEVTNLLGLGSLKEMLPRKGDIRGRKKEEKIERRKGLFV
jgi:DNA polymerase-1